MVFAKLPFFVCQFTREMLSLSLSLYILKIIEVFLHFLLFWYRDSKRIMKKESAIQSHIFPMSTFHQSALIKNQQGTGAQNYSKKLNKGQILKL